MLHNVEGFKVWEVHISFLVVYVLKITKIGCIRCLYVADVCCTHIIAITLFVCTRRVSKEKWSGT